MVLSDTTRQPPPDGTRALFFVQTFSTLGFAVLYSTLVLYATRHLRFPDREAATMMGVFGAFNYGLHLFGGYLGGRFMSHRNLFVLGMVLQVIGCAWIAGGTAALLYWGLAFFLTGSGLNVTCINMMLTQRYAPSDLRREGAFLWNYAGMNLGFFIGFAAAGHYQLTEDYRSLFLFATLGNLVAIGLMLVHWRTLRDRGTPLLDAAPSAFRWRLLAGTAIVGALVPLVWVLLRHTGPTETLIKALCACVAVALVVMTWRHPDRREQRNMLAYLILALGSLVFWTLYQMSPNGLQLFAVGNVDLHLWGVAIAPQWVQNINTVVIVVGGPLLSALFVRLRARGWVIDIPRQFAASLLLIGIGFLALPAGIRMAGADGRVAFVWLFGSYVLQSMAELLLAPIGYAMIGRLAPRAHQGVMMGSWMLVNGLGSLYAGDFSGLVPEGIGNAPVATNPFYARLFLELGLGSMAVGLVLAALVPLLRGLIVDAALPPGAATDADAAAMASPVTV